MAPCHTIATPGGGVGAPTVWRNETLWQKALQDLREIRFLPRQPGPS